MSDWRKMFSYFFSYQTRWSCLRILWTDLQCLDSNDSRDQKKEAMTVPMTSLMLLKCFPCYVQRMMFLCKMNLTKKQLCKLVDSKVVESFMAEKTGWQQKELPLHSFFTAKQRSLRKCDEIKREELVREEDLEPQQQTTNLSEAIFRRVCFCVNGKSCCREVSIFCSGTKLIHRKVYKKRYRKEKRDRKTRKEITYHYKSWLKTQEKKV